VVREYSYAFTAVAPKQGWMYSLILPKANSAMMSLFLAHVAQEYAEYFIVMQVDRAGWHRSKELVVPENIRLLPQPAHSPEVQPTEHIWDKVREKQFHNRVFEDMDAVEARLMEGLNALRAEPERVRSLTYFPHFRSVA
jgi:transposase